MSKWTSLDNFAGKLQTWQREIHPIAMHGCRSWEITSTIMHRLRRWELILLRKVLCLRRKITNGDLETPWDFNTRTGRRIFKLFADTGVIPLWRKVLQATFKQAWRETMNPIANTNMLRAIRCDRSRAWWAAMMANPSNKRETGSTKRARKGPVRMWEDTIVEALGIHWRSQMASCTTHIQWQGITRNAVEDLIHKWKLPNTALPSKDKVRMRIEEKVHTIAQQILLTSDTGPSVPGRSQFIVDCQPLSNIICGKAPITNPEYTPICERIFNNIHSIIGKGGHISEQILSNRVETKKFQSISRQIGK